MNKKAFLIFLSVVLTFYTLINLYIFKHGLHALPEGYSIRTYYIYVYAFLFLSYIAGRFLERFHLYTIAKVFIIVGSFWLAAMTYFFFMSLLIDIMRLLFFVFHFVPSIIYEDYNTTKMMLLAVAILINFILILTGHLIALNPKVNVLNLKINKPLKNMDELNIVAVSDIHIGTLIAKRRVARLAKRINALKPDIVLFVGDVIDEVLTHVVYYNMGEPLKTITAPLGVYGITGNHEYIGGAKAAVEYLQTLNIKVLRDEVVKIKDTLYIIGRDDRDKLRFAGEKRMEITSLLENLDPALPTILLDHQPFHLNQAADNNISLQLSGPTHHGQLFPFNLVTKKIFEVSCGYKLIKDTHFYVSNGYGTWGPPVRLFKRPEIVNIKLSSSVK